MINTNKNNYVHSTQEKNYCKILPLNDSATIHINFDV